MRVAPTATNGPQTRTTPRGDGRTADVPTVYPNRRRAATPPVVTVADGLNGRQIATKTTADAGTADSTVKVTTTVDDDADSPTVDATTTMIDDDADSPTVNATTTMIGDDADSPTVNATMIAVDNGANAPAVNSTTAVDDNGDEPVAAEESRPPIATVRTTTSPSDHVRESAHLAAAIRITPAATTRSSWPIRSPVTSGSRDSVRIGDVRSLAADGPEVGRPDRSHPDGGVLVSGSNRPTTSVSSSSIRRSASVPAGGPAKRSDRTNSNTSSFTKLPQPTGVSGNRIWGRFPPPTPRSDSSSTGSNSSS